MPRPPSDIDPRRLHVEAKKPRRRRNRKKPDPKPTYVGADKGVEAKLYDLPLSPGVMLEPTKGGGWSIESPHSDGALWDRQLAAAFGTRSVAAMRVFLRELKKLCRQDYDSDLQRWKRDETELNAALALVADWQPDNAAQAALAAQMVATHWMVMRLSAQAMNNGGMVMEKDAALAGKLARTYAMQCETMLMLKGRKKAVSQSFHIEKTLRQEVHYHTHPAGGAGETNAQPDAKDGGEQRDKATARAEGLPALPSAGEVHGEVVPFAGGDGANSLSDARRHKSGRSKG